MDDTYLDIPRLNELCRIDFGECDPETFLTQSGIESIHLIEAVAVVEETWGVTIDEDDIFSLQVKHLFLSKEEFEFVVFDKPFVVGTRQTEFFRGYCGILKQIGFTTFEILGIMRYKLHYLRASPDTMDDSQKKIQAHMLKFINMSRVVVARATDDDMGLMEMKTAFAPVQSVFCELQKHNENNFSPLLFQTWAKANAKMILYYDPGLTSIPQSIDEVNVVLEYDTRKL
jgi:acyl carrier protein